LKRNEGIHNPPFHTYTYAIIFTPFSTGGLLLTHRPTIGQRYPLGTPQHELVELTRAKLPSVTNHEFLNGAGYAKAFSSPTVLPFSSSAAGPVDAPCGVHLGSHRPWVCSAANYRATNANDTNDQVLRFAYDCMWMSSCADFRASLCTRRSTILEEPLNEQFLLEPLRRSPSFTAPAPVPNFPEIHLLLRFMRSCCSTYWLVARFWVGHYDPANPQG
jgi:hypothetical protein